MIPIIEVFDVHKKAPILEKLKVADQAGRLALNYLYVGLVVYQEDVDDEFKYIGDTFTNEVADWESFKTAIVGATGATGATGGKGLPGEKYKFSVTELKTIPTSHPTRFILTGVATDLAYSKGIEVVVAADSTNYFYGTLVSYGNSTFVVDSVSHVGSGTFSNWAGNRKLGGGGLQGEPFVVHEEISHLTEAFLADSFTGSPENPYIVLVHHDARLDKQEPPGLAGRIEFKLIKYDGTAWSVIGKYIGNRGLKGPDGFQGSQGPYGADGDPGEQGVDGTDKGLDGDKGGDGDIGDQGAEGNVTPIININLTASTTKVIAAGANVRWINLHGASSATAILPISDIVGTTIRCLSQSALSSYTISIPVGGVIVDQGAEKSSIILSSNFLKVHTCELVYTGNNRWSVMRRDKGTVNPLPFNDTGPIIEINDFYNGSWQVGPFDPTNSRPQAHTANSVETVGGLYEFDHYHFSPRPYSWFAIGECYVRCWGSNDLARIQLVQGHNGTLPGNATSISIRRDITWRLDGGGNWNLCPMFFFAYIAANEDSTIWIRLTNASGDNFVDPGTRGFRVRMARVKQIGNPNFY